MQNAKQAILNQLRQEVLLLEGYKPAHTGSCRIEGLEAVAAAFPNGVFPFGAVHELVSATREEATAGCGFVAGLLASLLQQGGVCLWIGRVCDIFPPGLKMFGIEPDQVLFIRLQSERDVLWAVEEALKCKGIAAVVGELQELSFAVSRRLQLAVETSQVTGFILRHQPAKITATACVARWQARPLASEPQSGMPGVGFPRWHIQLLKVKNGSPADWQLEWQAGMFFTIAGHAAVTTLLQTPQLQAG